METRKNSTRGRMNIKMGTVVSDKMDKTLSIKITRFAKCPRYKKYVKKYSTLKVHDPKSEGSMGDIVLVKETPKMSKTKTWKLLKILDHKSKVSSKKS